MVRDMGSCTFDVPRYQRTNISTPSRNILYDESRESNLRKNWPETNIIMHNWELDRSRPACVGMQKMYLLIHLLIVVSYDLT